MNYLRAGSGFNDENSVWILDTILNDIYERKQLGEHIPHKCITSTIETRF